MKIGILTLPFNNNYGGILQAYALQTVLERMGHDVTVIDKDRKIYHSKLLLISALGKYWIKKYILWRDVKWSNPEVEYRERNEREQYTRQFIGKYIKTCEIRHLEKNVPDDFDAFVVGSDQVWRKVYFRYLFRERIENAFLKFLEKKDVRRVAFSASFGTTVWEYTDKETAACGRLLKKFDAVSVRETSAIQLCKNKLGREGVIQTLDPTLLLCPDDYMKLVADADTKPAKGNLMCCVLDLTDEIQSLIERIAKEKNLTPYYSNAKADDVTVPNKERIQPPVEQWIRGIMDAEFVMTDSFHACVFSILFHKPFLAFGNKERGLDRFNSLLTLFGLQNNLILCESDYQQGYNYSGGISTDDILNDQREASVSFLKKALTV